MVRRRGEKKLSVPNGGASDACAIDARFGLEPVFEPGVDAHTDGAAASCGLRRIRCPYCGESYETLVDPSSGSATYIEDCQICCRPIEFHLEVDESRALATLTTHRSD